ncbi:lipase family protein [Roseibium sp. Sym1]|uniref:lipase family protein n=1 Tax=Roseibium sp. Sym1 TaxID=3016006 RepID=UPI0022B4E3E5|nr:lipase family protein [Roseibium sp. Sym1]
MSLALSPAQTVQLAQSAYAIRLDTDLLTAVQAAGTGGDQFDIASGSRFTGVSGISVPGGSSRTGFGYVAHGKAGTPRHGETLICVRGTEPTSVHDLITDAHMSAARSPLGLPVHEGFRNVAASILEQVQTALRGRNPGTLHIVGHSLGGAAATILAEALIGTASIKLYTYGAPRAGLDSHAQVVTAALGARNVYRVYHDTDPVPMVPIFPFCHIPVGEVAYLLRGPGALVSVSAHFLQSYGKSVGLTGWSGMPVIIHRRFSLDTVDDLLAQAQSSAIGPAMHSVVVLRLIEKILGLLLEAAGAVIGLTLFGGATVLDKMAAALASMAASSLAAAERVVEFVNVVMRFLGKRLVETGAKLTTAFLRWLLSMLVAVIGGMALQAIRSFR